jgi:hypothetical protein
VTLAAHVEQELLGLEEAISLDDRVKDISAFGGVLETLGPEESTEHAADGRHDLGRHGWHAVAAWLGRLAALGAWGRHA